MSVSPREEGVASHTAPHWVINKYLAILNQWRQ